MKPAMARRLLHRNIALLAAAVLVGQLLAGLLVFALVLRPQTIRIADATATMIGAISTAMSDLPPDRRMALVAQINAGSDLAIRQGNAPPSDGPRFPSVIERQFMLALARHLPGQALEWRTDRGRRLWVRLALGREDYWVSITPSRLRGPLASTLLALMAAFAVALAGGIALQRRLDRPLRTLAGAVDRFDPDRPGPPLDETGPQEIAAVAAAFNRMQARLAEQEAERALMLGGVSHDLRTPLTRLRLSLELMRGHDAELDATVARQVDQIEAMLGQFLDFARGFEAEPVRTCEIGALLAGVVAECDAPEAVRLDLAEDIRAAVRPAALARAVGNLVGNALRHGAAPVSITATRRNGDLTITVRDAGPGMDPEQAEALRRPFARGDVARGGGGGGLGLAIVERVAHAHGGSLGFTRSPAGFAALLRLPGAIGTG